MKSNRIWVYALRPPIFQVLGQTQDHRHRVLVAAARNIKIWFIKVRKIKAIYYTLNMLNLDVTQKCLIAECWCPVQDLDRIQQALRRGTVSYQWGQSYQWVQSYWGQSSSPASSVWKTRGNLRSLGFLCFISGQKSKQNLGNFLGSGFYLWVINECTVFWIIRVSN